MRNTRKLTLIAGTLAAVFGATAIAAQEQKPTPTLQAPMGQGQGMMQGGMPMMGMMQQMSQMMENCNKMMQTAMAQPTPGTPPAQPQPKP